VEMPFGCTHGPAFHGFHNLGAPTRDLNRLAEQPA
jgi:hypothetical protein